MTKQTSANQCNLSIETDAEKNKAADRVIDLLVGNLPADEKKDDDMDALAEKAGKALANRHCFAITDAEGAFAFITPTRYFKENGWFNDFDGPIGQLMPPHWQNSSESTWELFNSPIKTALDAAKSLQEYGFVWNREFQDKIEPSLTKELSVLEAKADKPAAVAPKANTRKTNLAPKG